MLNKYICATMHKSKCWIYQIEEFMEKSLVSRVCTQMKKH
jgi:hypothetical protein